MWTKPAHKSHRVSRSVAYRLEGIIGELKKEIEESRDDITHYNNHLEKDNTDKPYAHVLELGIECEENNLEVSLYTLDIIEHAYTRYKRYMQLDEE